MANPRQSPQEFFDSPKVLARFNEGDPALVEKAVGNGKIIVFTGDSNVALTVPTGLAIGFNCLIVQEGDGEITLTASGTNIYNRNSHTKTAGQYAVMSLFSYDTNKYISSGDGTS